MALNFDSEFPNIGREYRMDGIYVVNWTCLCCGEISEGLACSQYLPVCEACSYAMKREKDYLIWLLAVPTFWPYEEKNNG